MAIANTDANTPKRCFVVMGFGIKTDFATGRQLDLNKSYKILIKPVVESRGLACIRADEIKHAGSIDLHMYRELLDADIVIADLSTANVNAFYELGIRHALRRRPTIVISEDKLAYPFDLNHVKITSYTHLGGAIDFEEVERFRKVLGETIDAVLSQDDPDSPVYTHLQELVPPSIRKKAVKAMKKLEKEVKAALKEEDADQDEGQENSTLAMLAEQGESALEKKDFISAKAFFNAAVSSSRITDNNTGTQNSYLIHRLAMATYKAQLPDKVSALKEAIELLRLLDLDHTNDPETVNLAGKIEKRLYDNVGDVQHLSNAILYYERGYYLLHNRYHGINLAFLLNKRVDSPLFESPDEKIADMVLAARTRRTVLALCEKDWNDMIEREAKKGLQADLSAHPLIADNQAVEDDEKFWIQVNKAEAHFGLGQIPEYKKALANAEQIPHSEWMMKSFTDQINKLRILMNKHGHLLSPAWKESES